MELRERYPVTSNWWGMRDKIRNLRIIEIQKRTEIIYADKVLSGKSIFYFFHIDGNFCYIFHVFADYGSIYMV